MRASTSVAESFAGFGSTMGDDEIVAVFDTEGSAYAAGIASVSWYETEAPDTNGAGRGARERAGGDDAVGLDLRAVRAGRDRVGDHHAGGLGRRSVVRERDGVGRGRAGDHRGDAVGLGDRADRRRASPSWSRCPCRWRGTGSDVVADTVAVSVIGPSIVVVTTIVIGGGRPERHHAERTGDDAGRLRAAPLAGRRGDERHRAGEGVRDHDARRVGGTEVRHGDGVRDVVTGRHRIDQIGLRDGEVGRRRHRVDVGGGIVRGIGLRDRVERDGGGVRRPSPRRSPAG